MRRARWTSAGTFAGLLDTSGDALMIKNDGQPHDVALYADDGASAIASGSAFVDASVTVSNTDAVRVTGNFRAAGAWTT